MTIRLLLPVTEVVLPLDWLPEEAVVVSLELLPDLLVPELTRLPPVVVPLLLPLLEPETSGVPVLLPEVEVLVLPLVVELEPVLPEAVLVLALSVLRPVSAAESDGVTLTLRVAALGLCVWADDLAGAAALVDAEDLAGVVAVELETAVLSGLRPVVVVEEVGVLRLLVVEPEEAVVPDLSELVLE